MKSKKTRVLYMLMSVPCNNEPINKEHVIYIIVFSFEEDSTIIYCLENMNPYVSDIVESYKDTIISHLGN